MLRKGLRRALPRRDKWHSLAEYAVGEGNAEEFRLLRARDSAVSALVGTHATPPKAIDWASWESKISNKEVLSCLKDFHTQQTQLLDTVLKEDHMGAVKGQTAGWELFDASVKSCEKSVEKSELILRNGARALWISFQNPPISLLSQSEWLDTDQYWQAFVEKHHFYHNHLLSAVEDPESKEYDAKQKAELTSRWNVFDGRGTTRQNNKMLYQRPSFEYYDVYRGPLSSTWSSTSARPAATPASSRRTCPWSGSPRSTTSASRCTTCCSALSAWRTRPRCRARRPTTSTPRTSTTTARLTS